MGWFRTGHNDDTIGDMPADIIATVLTAYVADAPKPSLALLLAALETVLRGQETRFLEVTSAAPIGRLARRGIPLPGAVHVPPALRETVGEMMDRITRVYEDSCERKPRLTEVLASLIFTFQGEVAELLADGGEMALRPGDLIEIPWG